MSQPGLIHIYTGDGKGKTTAAVGLAVRFAGNGGTVVFTQFLKGNNSSELSILEAMEHIRLIRCEKSFGFTFRMTEEEKKAASEYYSAHLTQVIAKAEDLVQTLSGHVKEKVSDKEVEETAETLPEKPQKQVSILLILDEIIGAYNQNMVNRQELLTFLKNKPDAIEVVLTGRNPAPELLELADYVTVMEKQKHPYDKGIGARKGIEW